MLNSVYIHIPFCNNICSYCDFSKMYYNNSWVNKYLDSLEKEIENKYNNEIIKTLYIGGGSPSSLSLEQLNKLFNIIKIFKFDKYVEFTIEVNPDDIDIDKIKLFKLNNVNRVSIGVQSFNKKVLSILNRTHNKKQVLELIKKINNEGINNINIDMMYGIEKQTEYSLKKDIDILSNLNIKHISYYSLILEPNTLLYINNYKNINEDIELKQYHYIKKRLSVLGYNNYEISNYSLPNYESKHNLVYWNNQNYYGFGLSACGYIDNNRYENTRNINNYFNGKYILKNNYLDKKDIMNNEIMLGLRKIKGINKKLFYDKYNIHINDEYKLDNLIKDKILIDNGEYIFIDSKYLYISNEVIGRVLYG